MKRRLAPIMLAGLFVPGTLAHAQFAGERRGEWFTFGGARSSWRISCNECPRAGSFTTPTIALGFGGTLNPHVRLGFDMVAAWVNTPGDTSIQAGNVTLLARYYPAVHSGLFVEGGLGWSEDQVSVPGRDAGLGVGWGFTIGIGSEIRRWSKVALVPRLSYHYGSVGDLTYPRGGNTVAPNWSHAMLLVGIALEFNVSRFAGP